jgi:hypothetical protein
LIAGNSSGYKNLIEQLPGRSHERFSEAILLGSWCFSYHHKTSCHRPNAKDRLTTIAGQLMALLQPSTLSFNSAKAAVRSWGFFAGVDQGDSTGGPEGFLGTVGTGVCKTAGEVGGFRGDAVRGVTATWAC